jgi:hypothetical protein
VSLLSKPRSNHPGIIKFHADLEKAAGLVPIALETFLKALTLKLFQAIVTDTPVDTGRARASWNVGIGEPDTTVPPDISEADKKDRAHRRSNLEPLRAHPQFAAAVESARVPANLSEIDGTKKIFITSNLVYIEALEHGHSQRQAPHGMVAVNVAAMETYIEAGIQAAQNATP